MAFTDEWTLANDATFIQRVTMAAVKAAIDISAEDPATALHAMRVRYATYTLSSPIVVGQRLSLGVVTNPSITGASTDSDIQFTVNSMWNAYAAVAGT